MARNRFEAMDGLRGVAAMLVVSLHAAQFARMGDAVPFPFAYLAVDLFFMLSGFVIAHAYEEKLQADMSVARFVWKRFVRLYPLAVVGTLLTGIVLLVNFRLVHPIGSIGWIARGTIRGLLFVPQLRGEGAAFPINPPMWSLFYEFWINVAYAVFLPWLTTRRLALVAAVAGVAGVFLAMHSVELGGNHAAGFGMGLVRVIWGFVVGLLIFHAWRAGRLHELPVGTSIVAMLTFAGLCSATLSGAASELYVIFLLIVALPAIVAACVWAPPGGGLAPCYKGLGWISFPLYAVHWSVLSAAALMASEASRTKWVLAASALSLLVACAASVLSEKLLTPALSRLGVARCGPAPSST